MKKLLGLLCAFLLVQALIIVLLNRKDEGPVTWVKSNLKTIDHAYPDEDTDDLSWLDQAVGQADVVGAGEATHGTREFFQLKHRLFQHLVINKGFRVFALEAPYFRALAINEFLQTGEGDPAQLVHDMGFWPWDTEEVVDLVRWMRSYNETHKEKLSFYGFDVQGSSNGLLFVLDYLERLEDEKAKKLAKPFTLYRKLLSGKEVENRSKLVKKINSPTSLVSLTRGATDIYLYILNNKASIIEQTSAEEYQNAHGASLAAAWGLRMSNPDMFRFTGSHTVRSVRDHGMADMIHWGRNNLAENGKVYVWAHNAHVAKTRQKDVDITLGMILGEELGSDYFNIGFVFNQGSFQAMDPNATGDQKGKLVEFTLGPAKEGYIDHMLAQAEEEMFFLDLRQLPRGSKADHWFNVPKMLRWTGAVYSDELEAKHPPRHLINSYDSLIFVEQTSRAQPTALSQTKW